MDPNRVGSFTDKNGAGSKGTMGEVPGGAKRKRLSSFREPVACIQQAFFFEVN
jgi:hypothetical protein